MIVVVPEMEYGRDVWEGDANVGEEIGNIVDNNSSENTQVLKNDE